MLRSRTLWRSSSSCSRPTTSTLSVYLPCARHTPCPFRAHGPPACSLVHRPTHARVSQARQARSLPARVLRQERRGGLGRCCIYISDHRLILRESPPSPSSRRTSRSQGGFVVMRALCSCVRLCASYPRCLWLVRVICDGRTVLSSQRRDREGLGRQASCVNASSLK